LYAGRKMFDNYLVKLKSPQFYQCLVTASPKLDIKCEAISKVLLFMWYAKDDMTLEHKKNIMKSVYFELIARLCDGKEVSDFYKLDDFTGELKEKLERNITYDDLATEGLQDSLQYYTLSEYETAIKVTFDKMNDDFKRKFYDTGYQFDTEKLCKLYRCDAGDVTVPRLKQFMELYFGDNFENEISLQYLTYLAITNNNSFERHCNEDLTQKNNGDEENSRKCVIDLLVSSAKADFRKKTLDRLVAGAQMKYDDRFMDAHSIAVPLSQSEVIKIRNKAYWNTICTKHVGKVVSQGIVLDNYNKESNLIRLSCMCPDCPFFLNDSTKILNHLEPWVRRNECTPALHRVCKMYQEKEVEFILNKVIDGSILHPGKDKPVVYNKQKLEAIKDILREDIAFLKERYRDIKNGDMTYVDQVILAKCLK
jgi:hypothetical protein